MHKFKFSNGKSFPVVFLCFWKEMWPQEIVKLCENVHFRVQITFLLIPWDPISWTKNKIHIKFSLNFLLSKSAGEVTVTHLFFTYYYKVIPNQRLFFKLFFIWASKRCGFDKSRDKIWTNRFSYKLFLKISVICRWP